LWLLLAALGVSSLAALGAGSSMAPGTSTLNAGSTSAARDPALLRYASRLLGLQTVQPLYKGHDGEDPVEPPPAAAAGFDAAPADAALQASPVPAAAALRRPLHGLPQSPRAPPHLA
jgi:hypothetical protein